MSSSRVLVAIVSAIVANACGTPNDPRDGSTDAAADGRDAVTDADGHVTVCVNDTDCDDHIFCNGSERCMPGAANASSLGCAPANPAYACMATQLCDEANARCLTQCTTEPDADGDGHRSRACGGDDCDDADGQRFPGNAEVCDPTHDEDCDLATVGVRDEDNDLETSATCCNRPSGALAACGTDCNDGDPGVHTRASEVCDGVDNNCNGAVDEGVQRTFFPDVDHDNFGDARAATPTLACAATAGFVENSLDCDDTDPLVNPAAAETCNGHDDNCNGAADENPSAGLYCAMSYGTPANTTFGCTTDATAMTGTCTVSTCRGGYGNCDMRIENGCETDLQTSPSACGDCTVQCGSGGTCTAGTCDHFTHVAVGIDYVCASRTSGNVVCWGANAFGQLGDGSTIDAPTPVFTGRFPDTRSLAAGRFDMLSFGPPLEQGCPATCVQNGNSLQCWGCNASAQTGIGVVSGSVLTPSAVRNFPAFDAGGWRLQTVEREVSIGAGHACGWQMNANDYPVVYCWGRNDYGQADPTRPGAGAVTTAPTAIPFMFNHDNLSVGAGGRHTCVATTTPMRGYVRCWGSNTFGQRGPGTPDASGIALVPPPTGEAGGSWVEVTAGNLFTCGRFASGRVACWGGNGEGQLGDGSTVASRAAPGLVPGLGSTVQLASSTRAACARDSSGSVRCWGQDYGTTPQLIPGLTDAVEIAMGGPRGCAVRATGTIECWQGVTTPTRPAGTGNW